MFLVSIKTRQASCNTMNINKYEANESVTEKETDRQTKRERESE